MSKVEEVQQKLWKYKKVLQELRKLRMCAESLEGLARESMTKTPKVCESMKKYEEVL